MHSLTLLGFTAFLVAFLLTPLARNLARRFGLVDEPGEERRVHSDPIPRIGGIPIVLAIIGAFGVLFLADLAGGRLVREALPFVPRLIPGAAMIFMTGLLDDLFGLKPVEKFAGQLVGAVLAIWAGVCVTGVGGFGLPLWVAVPVTLIWLIGCANAFNLIDGVGRSGGRGGPVRNRYHAAGGAAPAQYPAGDGDSAPGRRPAGVSAVQLQPGHHFSG